MNEPTLEDFRDSWACEHVRPELSVEERRASFDRMIARVRTEAQVEAINDIADGFGPDHFRRYLRDRAARIAREAGVSVNDEQEDEG